LLRDMIDTQEPPATDAIYTLCDMALSMVAERSINRRWNADDALGEIAFPPMFAAPSAAPTPSVGVA
jgi:hypothetical protein